MSILQPREYEKIIMETTGSSESKWDFSTPDKKLHSYLLAKRPIIYINGSDFREIDVLIREQAPKAVAGKVMYDEFSFAQGRRDFESKATSDKKCNSLEDFLLEDFLIEFDSAKYKHRKEKHILVLKEVHDKLNDPRVYSLLQSIAGRMRESVEDGDMENNYYVQVLIVDSQKRIPPELDELVTLIEIRPPQKEDISEIVENFKCKNQDLKFEEGFSAEELVNAFVGLSKYAIEQTLRLAYEVVPTINKCILTLINEEKSQLVQKSGVIEFVGYNDISDVGGLDKLNEYINGTCTIFHNLERAKEWGVDTPKGIMIVGMPGCGKTLMAKNIGKKFGVPLIKVDIGRLMGKYVGDSEHNLHRAIAIAEAASPCVLWIDEIEKAFSGIGGDDGGGSAMTRMFGIFLTWMQDKKAPVYVVATSNNINKLPPEFLRRGRFDEIFSVVFPTDDECAKILETHLKKRCPSLTDAEIAKLKTPQVKKALSGKNFSGSDIESMVNETMKSIFLRANGWTSPQKITEKDLLDVIKKTESNYSSQKDELDKMLKRIKELHVRPAS